MNPAEVAERGAELVEKIRDELGPTWTQLPGLAGSQKGFVVWDDGQVALTSVDADWAIYLVDGELWSRVRRGGNILTGRLQADEFRVTATTPDPSQN